MKIDHIAVWTRDIERLRSFYCIHFNATSGTLYRNAARGFSSYFLSFAGGARLEIMQRTDITCKAAGESLGFAHLALSTGSREAVLKLTETLRAQQVPVVGEPRWTGDGYFESIVADPDGNRIEITI